MKRWMIVGLMVLAFIGLIFVQLRLLWTGVLLEMNRFNRAIYQVLQSVQREIEEDEQLLQHLNIITSTDYKFYLRNHASVMESTKQTLQTLLEEAFQHQGISARFSFAIMSANEHKTFLRSDDFRSRKEQHERYRILLKPGFQTFLPFNNYLQLYINNLFPYLLRQLAYLIIPSLLFLLILLGSFVYLLRATLRLQRLDHIKNDFINNLTHELKTPVFSISLISRMLKESFQQKKYTKLGEYLPLLDQENDKLKGHIDKVLELASLESGRQHLQFMPVEVHELLQELLWQFEAKAKLREGKLEQHFRASQSSIQGDETHLANAIQNLLENALKYNRCPPFIRITTTNRDGFLEIKIRDNGIGVPSDQQKKVFEKFYRIPSGDVHDVKGFGLGLHYVRHIVEAHGGRIELKSQLGKGSVFSVFLPLKH